MAAEDYLPGNDPWGYYLDAYGLSEYREAHHGPRYERAPLPKTCYLCGQRDLQWIYTEGRWRLSENGRVPHQCKRSDVAHLFTDLTKEH